MSKIFIMKKKPTSPLSFFDRQWLIAGIFLLLTFLVYGNSLKNEFAVIDDLQGYIQNERIHDLTASFQTLNLQQIVYALNYMFVGNNPVPLRMLALLTHTIVAILLYSLISKLFSKKVAFLATLLCIVHPVNSESIDWISAQFYIVLAIFLYLSLLIHEWYITTSEKKYLYALAGVFGLAILIIQHPWTLIIPLAVLTKHFFFPSSQKNVSFYTPFLSMIIPLVVIFFVLRMNANVQSRIKERLSGSDKTTTNQQQLKPIVEGYPYTISEMVRLYTFPKNLTIYYDGEQLSQLKYISMYLISLLYLFGILYFYRKDRRISGLLVMLLVLIAPLLSPIKLTWFMTERYLYFGTGFYTTLLILFFLFLEKKTSIKNLTVVLTGIVFLLFAIQTIIRNTEWKNPETIALATIHTSPLSIRPYNDLAGYYVLQGRYDKAISYYEQALQRGNSLTAMRDLGYIYMKNGIDTTVYTSQSTEELFQQGSQALKNQDSSLAMFYFKEVVNKDPQFPQIWEKILNLYIEGGLYEKAQQILQKRLASDPLNPNLYYLQGYLAFKTGNNQEAITNLEKVLELDPENAEARSNLQMIRSSM